MDLYAIEDQQRADEESGISAGHGLSPGPGPEEINRKEAKRQVRQVSLNPAEKAGALRLSFVKPCPVCDSRYFRFVSETGFHCVQCHPDIQGQLVSAGGAAGDVQRQSVTIVTSINSAKFDDGFQPAEPAKRRSRNELERFTVGFPWVKENFKELVACGWARADLFRRSKHRWPLGKWGLAWLFPVDLSGVSVRIGQSGEVRFTRSSNGRVISQSVFPSKAVRRAETSK